MQEFDLKNIWDSTDAGAARWYRELPPELVAIAQKKNDSVMARIRRLVLAEIVFAVVVLGAAVYFMRSLPTLFYASIIVFFVLVIILSYRYYRQFSQEIEQVPALNIVKSTAAYLRILGDYKNRLIRMSIALMPVGLIAGFFAGFGVGAENDFSALQEPKLWLISAVALILVAIPSYLLTKWYYRFFLGSKEKELEQVLARLREEQEEE